MADTFETTISTNDIKRGMRVEFRDGRMGTMMDNKRGNIRCIKVDGPFREMGDCYMYDVWRAELEPGKWGVVCLTKAQLAFKLRVRQAGF